MESPKFLKHMMISMGDKTYLTLPVGGGLVSGHTRLVAMEHGVCCKEMDEETFAEINKFKYSLIKMFKVCSRDISTSYFYLIRVVFVALNENTNIKNQTHTKQTATRKRSHFLRKLPIFEKEKAFFYRMYSP